MIKNDITYNNIGKNDFKVLKEYLSFNINNGCIKKSINFQIIKYIQIINEKRQFKNNNYRIIFFDLKFYFLLINLNELIKE